MSRDRYERKHRFTNPLRREANLTSALNAPSETLAEAMGIAPLPSNFVAEVNGHHIYRDESNPGRYHLWTPGTGWWGFDLTEEYARRVCVTVAPTTPTPRRSAEGETA